MANDDTGKLREITVRFLHGNLGKLMDLEQRLSDNPHDPKLRSMWLRELDEFSERVQRLSGEWHERYKDDGDVEDGQSQPLCRITRQTPINGNEL